MIDQIVNEMLLASEELQTNKVSRIAEELGYQPILIMNALFKGERDGKFVYVKKRDIIRIADGIEFDKLQVTDGVAESRAVVEEFIANENGIETDLTIDELRTFIPNLPELHLKLAVRTSDKLSRYDFADPKDKKSVYTFITLNENVDKKFGAKQFDETKENKFAKAGKKTK